MKIPFLADFPFTSGAIAFVSVLTIPILVSGDIVLISGAMIQAGWCSKGDFICLLCYYFAFSLTILILGLLIDFGIKRFKRGKFKNHKPIIAPIRSKTIEKKSEILNVFSSYLDELTKDKKISGLGISFLKNIKTTPPFLGIQHNQPVIPYDIERKITEYFLATEFMDENKKYIKGGYVYKVKPNDTWERIAENVFGNIKFSSQIKVANHGVAKVSTGQGIYLPYIDVSELLGMSSEQIKKKIAVAQIEWIEPTLDTLVNKLNLIEDETLWLLKMIYGAAQKAAK